MLPALFGCLVLGFIGNDVGGGITIKGRLKAAIVPFIFFIVLYLLISDLYEAFEGFLMIIGIGMVYLITKKMYKAGKIEVILPESDSMEAAAEVDSLQKIICQGEGSDISLLDRLPEKVNGQEQALNRIFLDEMLGKLEAQERLLIYMRYYRDMTQTEIGKKMGISQVQVSRMEKRILQKLKKEYG